MGLGIIEAMKSGQRLSLLEQNKLFPAAVRIIRRLDELGARTVMAGGCVRDALLGDIPKDIDLATSAKPDVVESAFVKTLAVGKAFGTIVVVEDGHNFEVTTFRRDGPYLDGRHPSEVRFTDMEEDAKRRDFTANALFYDPDREELIDYVGGVADIQNALLRTVGRAADRFQQDRLRMLRAARFAAQLGFTVDAEATRAIEEQAPELKLVSVERVFNETKRMLEAPFLKKGLDVLLRTKLYEAYWPELRDLDLAMLDKFSKFRNWENAFAALCILRAVKDPEPRLRAWKVSRESLKRVQQQLQGVRILRTSTLRSERVRALGSDVYAELVVLLAGLCPEEKVETWIQEYVEVAAPDGSLPKPLLTGEDVRKLGVAPGERMGRILKEAQDAQFEGRIRTREQALEWLRKIKD